MIMPNKHNYGIKIVYGYNPEKNLFRANFFISAEPNSEHFVSNEIISSLARKELFKANILRQKKGLPFVSRKRLGGISLEVNGDTATWNDYNPFERFAFEGKGIANLLELITVKELKKRFPSVEFFDHFGSVSDERIAQIKKRGFDPEEDIYSFEELVKALKEKIKRDSQKAKKKVLQKKLFRKRLAANKRKPKLRRTNWLNIRKAA